MPVTAQGSPGGALSMCPASQSGEATMLFVMGVQQNGVDPTQIDSVSGTLCALDFPAVTELQGTCDPQSTSLVTVQLGAPPAGALHVGATATGSLDGGAAGAWVSIGALDVIGGSSAASGSLPVWNTNSSSCSSTSVGTSNTCDTTCVSNCAVVRDDDSDGYPGVTYGVCGSTAADVSGGVTCNASSPSTPGTTLQGWGDVVFEVNPSVGGTVQSSCEITGGVSTSVTYDLVGGNAFYSGAQLPVTSLIFTLPSFAPAASGSTLHMVRIDGQYGTPNWNLDLGQPGAACATALTHVGEL